MHFLELARMTVELVLAVSIKLFCDHGRIHWRDLVDDLWTGRAPYETPITEPAAESLALAAK